MPRQTRLERFVRALLAKARQHPYWLASVVIFLLEACFSEVLPPVGFHRLRLTLREELVLGSAWWLTGLVVTRIILSNDWVRLKLYGRRGMTKSTFEQARCPRNWSEYFVLQLKLADLKPLHYPYAPEDKPIEVPAYELFRCDDGAQIHLDPRHADKNSPYVNRYSGLEGDVDNHFRSEDFDEFRHTTGVRLESEPAYWVTGVSAERHRLFYECKNYVDTYVLCNDEWFQGHKFPTEEHFPFLSTQKQSRSRKGTFGAFETNPPILGLDAILVTKDGRFVMQRRSSKTAVNRVMFCAAVSAGYKEDDFRNPAEAITEGAYREAMSELTLARFQITTLKPIGAYHIVNTSEVNVALWIETALTFAELNAQLKGKMKLKERGVLHYFELRKHNPLVSFKYQEIIDFSGEWRAYFERNRSPLNRMIFTLHYCKVAHDMGLVPTSCHAPSTPSAA